MAKVNIYIPDELLGRIDGLADEQGRSRSSIVQEAAAHYVAETMTSDERAERRNSILQAIREADKLRAAAAERDPYPDIPLSETLIEERRLDHEAPMDEIARSIRRRRSGRE